MLLPTVLQKLGGFPQPDADFSAGTLGLCVRRLHAAGGAGACVDDQDKALCFHTEVLGFAKKADFITPSIAG